MQLPHLAFQRLHLLALGRAQPVARPTLGRALSSVIGVLPHRVAIGYRQAVLDTELNYGCNH